VSKIKVLFLVDTYDKAFKKASKYIKNKPIDSEQEVLRRTRNQPDNASTLRNVILSPPDEPLSHGSIQLPGKYTNH
jgi:hypothetical protein